MKYKTTLPKHKSWMSKWGSFLCSFKFGTKCAVTIQMNNENLGFSEAGTETESFHCSKSGSVVYPIPCATLTKVWLPKWIGHVFL